MEIKIQKTTAPKAKPADETKLGFGHIFTDHMFVMNYDGGQGWHDARIIPYGEISLSPAAMCLHYGQEIFEGLKAYRTADGSVQMFRPDENFKRMNVSAERMVIPHGKGLGSSHRRRVLVYSSVYLRDRPVCRSKARGSLSVYDNPLSVGSLLLDGSQSR